MTLERLISILAFAVALALVPFIGRAERVTYSFKADWQPYATGNLTLFGVTDIPRDASVTGAFTYETSTAGVGAGPTAYAQLIDAGFTLDVGYKLHLSASDFSVRISNDFQRPDPPPATTVTTVDLFKVVFDTISGPATPLMVNGVPWTGTSRNYVNLQLCYPGDTLSNTNLPSMPPSGFNIEDLAYSFLGDSPVNNSLFLVTSVVLPIAGDYDVNGAVDAGDFNEWTRAFGCSGLACGPADGNHDGTVGSADYVLWRRASAGAAGNGASTTYGAPLPEPSALAMSFLLWAEWMSFWRGRCRREQYH